MEPKKIPVPGRDVEHERELIKKVQMTDDPIAMKELMKLYRGIVNSATYSSEIRNYLPIEVAKAEARKIVEDAIRSKFDLSKDNLPSTYLYGLITYKLRNKKEQSRDSSVHRSEEKERKSAIYHSAANDLRSEWNREPSDDEIFQEIVRRRDKMKARGEKWGTDFKREDIGKVKSLVRRSIVGNLPINEDMPGGAITPLSIGLQGDLSGEDAYSQILAERRLRKILEDPKYTRPERRAIYSLAGIGEFKNRKAKNNYQAANDAGITYYDLTKAIKKLEDDWKKGG